MDNNIIIVEKEKINKEIKKIYKLINPINLQLFKELQNDQFDGHRNYDFF